MAKNQLQNKRDYHIFKFALVGDAGVGKTSLFVRYFDDKFEDSTVTTVGIDFRVKNLLVDGKRVQLVFWDSAGQERYRTFSKSYYRGVHAVLIVFSVDNSKSFENVSSWVDEVRQFAESKTQMLLVGNKCDVAFRQVTYQRAKKLADQLGIDYFESSAKMNINVDPMIMEMASKIIAIQENSEESNNKSVDTGKDRVTLSDGCSKHEKTKAKRNNCC